MKPNVVQRVIAVAGENFDSRGCRVTNPYITARESIELGDYIVALEEENKKLNSRLVADPNVVDILRSIEDPDYLVTGPNTTEEKMAGVETDIERLLAENKALKLLLEAEKANSSSQRHMKDIARKQRDKVTKQLSEVTQILEFYKKGLDIGIEQDLECSSVKKGIEGFMKSREK